MRGGEIIQRYNGCTCDVIQILTYPPSNRIGTGMGVNYIKYEIELKYETQI